MINWKTLETSTPTNVGRAYPDAPETPYVSCVVWVCNPDVISGGVADVVRWDTKNKCWYGPDLLKWFYDAPYRITHFCDDINIPDKIV